MEQNGLAARAAWRVVGRVQGVGFRWWAVRSATRLGLRGTVRNCADGSVEVVASGDPDAVSRFAALLAEGPVGARVDALLPVSVAGPLPPDFHVIV